MRLEAAYDASFDPPAPVVPVGVEGPSGAILMVPMLLDTGADCTLIPGSLRARLSLPQVDRIKIAGVTGGRRDAAVYAAWLSLGPTRVLARLVAFEQEAILGRDVLAALVTRLHGPRQRLTLSR